ncbi:MAG: hypothetical protein CFE30_27280 [Bradyrhizobium sp. PARBB1]|nr:MAG: hypothetical protein CFE30_27280 [Bradyrhizobium sp. PARBB1]
MRGTRVHIRNSKEFAARIQGGDDALMTDEAPARGASAMPACMVSNGLRSETCSGMRNRGHAGVTEVTHLTEIPHIAVNLGH